MIKLFFQTRSDTMTYSMEMSSMEIQESGTDMETVPFEAIQSSL